MAEHRVSKRLRNYVGGKEQPEFTGKSLRKIRVICSDPEATDSSSDEADSGERSSPRRIVCEIVIGVKPEEADEEAVDRKEAVDQTQRKKLTGVRLRKWGKWAAEIRDPFSRKRIWLGTYNTAEEASKAYTTKKQEFQARLSAPTLPKSDGESSTQASQEADRYSTEGDEKEAVVSDRVVPGHDPIGKSKVVHWKKWDRWGANVCDPVVKPNVESDTRDPEEEASNILQAMKMGLRPGHLAPFGSESGSPPKSPKTDTLSLLSGGGGGGETISGTTTTTTTTAATSMEVSTEEKGVTTTTEEEGQICENVNREEGNKPPWMGLGIGMLVIDNNGNLLGQFSRLDDDLRIC